MKKKIFHFFSIDSSSRHEKSCQILHRLFLLFQCSKNPQCWPFTSQIYCSCDLKIVFSIFFPQRRSEQSWKQNTISRAVEVVHYHDNANWLLMRFPHASAIHIDAFWYDLRWQINWPFLTVFFMHIYLLKLVHCLFKITVPTVYQLEMDTDLGSD